MLRRPLLTVLFAYYCVDDVIDLSFNGYSLRALRQTPDLYCLTDTSRCCRLAAHRPVCVRAARADAEVTDERALSIQAELAAGMELQAPLGMSAHWFRYSLPVGLLRQGINQLEVSVS